MDKKGLFLTGCHNEDQYDQLRNLGFTVYYAWEENDNDLSILNLLRHGSAYKTIDNLDIWQKDVPNYDIGVVAVFAADCLTQMSIDYGVDNVGHWFVDEKKDSKALQIYEFCHQLTVKVKCIRLADLIAICDSNEHCRETMGTEAWTAKNIEQCEGF
jgi:hypothetical protein